MPRVLRDFPKLTLQPIVEQFFLRVSKNVPYRIVFVFLLGVDISIHTY